jgi:peptidoglycan hydrolase-like protein with peptidoglycan-binding domain
VGTPGFPNTGGTFERALSLGSSGTDVAVLQTALEQQGFFVMPAGVVKGYFGAITEAAVIKYQTSVGLPPVGVFGPATRAKLFSNNTGTVAAPASVIPFSGKGVSKSEAISAFVRSLSVGTRGADVIMLQTILEQKGFLTMPVGVSKGYFGPLTTSTVVRYQANVGLPQVGIFGPLTRVKLISELAD